MAGSEGARRRVHLGSRLDLGDLQKLAGFLTTPAH